MLEFAIIVAVVYLCIDCAIVFKNARKFVGFSEDNNSTTILNTQYQHMQNTRLSTTHLVDIPSVLTNFYTQFTALINEIRKV